MANPFEPETAPGKTDIDANPITAPSGGFTSNPFEPSAKPKEPEKPKDDKSYKPTMFGQLTDRLASGFTLGLTDMISGLINPKSKEDAANFKKEHPYLSTGAEIAGGIGPGIASGLVVGKALPALGKATIPSMMGNAAVSGAGMTMAEDLIKEQRINPLKTLLSAGIGAGGAGVTGGLLRAFSPDAKFRAAGSDLTGADKAAMKDLAATGDRAGIPLRIPELAAERAPGRAAAVEGLDNFMGRLKSGEIERRNFDAGRLPNLQKAVDVVKRVVGPAEETGLGAQTGAKMAIKDAEDLVRASARPDYDAAQSVVLPRRQDTPNILETRKEVYGDRVVGDAIKNADPNSISVLQHVADAIEGQIKQAGTKSGPAKEAMLIAQKRGLLKEMEAASPEFARAQATTAGGKGMVEEIKAGPLGIMANTTKPNTQARALLDAEPNAARKATERLSAVDPELPASILATEVNSLSKDPISFGRKLAPTPDSEKVINQIVGDQDFSAIKDIITASRARTKAPAPGGGENSDSPWGAGWDAFQNMSSRGVTKRMNDPANIDKLGEAGVLQRLLNAFGLSTEDVALDNMFREPLVVDVKPKRKENTRTANAR